MINKCKICGKEFEAKQRNYNICSVECREINQRDSKKAFRENNPDKVKQYIKIATNVKVLKHKQSAEYAVKLLMHITRQQEEKQEIIITGSVL